MGWHVWSTLAAPGRNFLVQIMPRRARRVGRGSTASRSSRRPQARSLAGRMLLGGLVGIVLLASAGPSIVGASHQQPLTRPDFVQSGETGFGDRRNTWAWSMAWWNNRLYVGTNREWRCVSDWMNHFAFAGFAYPSNDPDMAGLCPQNVADLDLRAEIWRWTPGQATADPGTWERVYQSPQIPNPDYPGRMTAREVAFRSLDVYRDPSGQEALYAFSVNTKAMWAGRVPPPTILRTTDGAAWDPIPQDPGTFMGELPNASFRSPASFNGQLFAIHATVQGNGPIVASPYPALGNDQWTQVSPEGEPYYAVAPFNGWLYAATFDPFGGYSIQKTRAVNTANPNSPDPPYEWITVVDRGAYRGSKPADFILQMYEFDGRLYVGADSHAEVIRINPDDTWDLVVGTPRQLSDGRWIYPLSTLDEGFSNGFNKHIWRMGAYDGQLYTGTYDSSTIWNGEPQVDAAVRHLLGFDLFRTDDGWYYSPLSTDGFGFPLAMGVRQFAGTPYGLFFGTANDTQGLQIWRGSPKAETNGLAAPARVEVEVGGGRPVLSWEPVPGAQRYVVFRAPLRNMQLPIIPGSWTSGIANIQDLLLLKEYWFPEPLVQAGVTRDTVFVDTGAANTDTGRYIYVVAAEGAQGRRSAYSNQVQVWNTALRPPAMTFGLLGVAASRLYSRGRFTSEQEAVATRSAIEQVRGLVANGELVQAFDQLQALRAQILAGSVVQSPDAKDLEIQVSKLLRRIKLARHGVIDPASLP